ncbi:DUF1542 domain-containing protein [Nocardia goodfellowii]|uniref:DUF1542 domain-containing protein n=1 Tax=Nocardia goodfellowii TaxID=882446 RepID=A0ABS4Q8P0_9NOCA|nr:DUF1542 domain-containing protein [Nocardia goodfellowii]MBP2187520.1 hypothetical protein [Nocardia goodfellowii]
MIWLLLLLVLVIVAILVIMRPKTPAPGLLGLELGDALAEARRENERLGGQVYNLVPSNNAAKQALAAAAEHHSAAGTQLERAETPAQARLAKLAAIEGLHYIRAARTAMDLDPGPAIPHLANQNRAGHVTEDRTADCNGRPLAASPHPSATTPYYYPGGMVAGRPVPGGWYSEPWWRTALLTGAWGVGSTVLFSSLFGGMAGVGYDAETFEQGFDDGSDIVGYDGGQYDYQSLEDNYSVPDDNRYGYDGADTAYDSDSPDAYSAFGSGRADAYFAYDSETTDSYPAYNRDPSDLDHADYDDNGYDNADLNGAGSDSGNPS